MGAFLCSSMLGVACGSDSSGNDGNQGGSTAGNRSGAGHGGDAQAGSGLAGSGRGGAVGSAGASGGSAGREGEAGEGGDSGADPGGGIGGQGGADNTGTSGSGGVGRGGAGGGAGGGQAGNIGHSGTGGGAADSCPATAPSNGDPCTGSFQCTYFDCDGAGQISAFCNGTTVSTEVFPCAGVACGSIACEPGSICVEHRGGMDVECVEYPCGARALTCGCADELCGPAESCRVTAATVHCEQ